VKIIKTKDGSITLYNEDYKDFYHSREGAIKEALYHFLYPLKTLLKKKNNFNFVEIGYGLGYNALVFNYFLTKNKKDFQYRSIEKDKELFKFIEKNCRLFKIKNYCSFLKKMKNNIIFEDATKVNYKKLIKKEKLNILIHDGFSPSKNKELWSYEFFKKLKGFDIIITYTNNPKVRIALFLNDFYVLPTFRFKNSGTLAIKDLKLLNLLNYRRYSLREFLLLFTNYAKPFDFNDNFNFPLKFKGGRFKAVNKEDVKKLIDLYKTQNKNFKLFLEKMKKRIKSQFF